MVTEIERALKIFGLEFAPLKMPIQRRLQTITVALFFCCLLSAMFTVIPVLIYMLLFSKFWFVPVLCLMWIYYDRKTPYTGGRKWKEFRNSKIWQYFRDYYPIRLVKTDDLSPYKNYIFCVYPHGVTSSGALLNFMSNANHFDELYPGINPHLVTLNAQFRIPFSRELFLAIGAISASESSMIHCLTSAPGNSCVLMPGGASEAVHALPGKYTVVLKKRRGFVRIALKTGASLVPVFTFGENDLYDQLTSKWINWLQGICRRYCGLTPCLLVGRGFFQYSFGLLPRRRPLVTIVGKQIEVPKIENATPELIEEYHQKYIDALVALFEENKGKYHPEGSHVELIIK